MLLLAILVFSCSDISHYDDQREARPVLRAEIPNAVNSNTERPAAMKEQISTFLTFQDNNAEEAMHFYISLFDHSKVLEVHRHGKEGPGKEGTILFAKFELNGSSFACSDSPAIHDWTFTPGVSNFVECRSEEEIQTLYDKLSEDGQVMMPLDNYGWSTKFGFVADRYGVSWQTEFAVAARTYPCFDKCLQFF